MWNDTLKEFADSFKKVMVVAPIIKYKLDIQLDSIKLDYEELKEFEGLIEDKIEHLNGKKKVNTPRPTTINEEGEKSVKTSNTVTTVNFLYEDIEPGDHAFYNDFTTWLHANCERLEIDITKLQLSCTITKGKAVDEDEDE